MYDLVDGQNHEILKPADIAINSVNPSFIWRLEFFKEWLVKYFFVHKIVFKASVASSTIKLEI
jgi:hypothetical protein